MILTRLAVADLIAREREKRESRRGPLTVENYDSIGKAQDKIHG